MKHKRLFFTIIIVFYIVVVVLCLAFLFSVKKVDSVYNAVTNSEKYLEVEKKLSSYEGKNLLFVNTNKIKQNLQKDPYIIVKSVKKDFPNKIKVEIEERQETFIIESDLKRFYLDKNFYVLKVEDKQSTLLNNQLILLNVSNYKNFDYTTLNTHSVVVQIDGWIKNSITEMINIFTDWKNILGGIEVTGTNDILGYNIYFKTRQGLVIEVKDPNIGYNENNEPVYKEPSDTEGIDIIRKVYEKYSTISDDEKTKGKLLVTKQQDGTITVVHSTRG